MEDQLNTPVASLPPAIWRIILDIYLTACMEAKTIRGYRAILKPIYRCKMASKNLNKLFNDEFIFEAIKNKRWRKLGKALYKQRVRAIIKIGASALLEDFYNTAQRYIAVITETINTLFPLVVQRGDLPFLERYVSLFPGMQFYRAGVLNGIEYTYRRGDKAQLEYLLKLYSRCMYPASTPQVTKLAIEQVIKVLKEKEPNVAAYHVLGQILQETDESTLNDQINRLFSEQVFDRTVIVPEGELLNLEKLSQNKAFKGGLTNFCIRRKKDALDNNHVSLFYRDQNGTKNEVEISTRTDQSGDSTTTTYMFEGKSTQNMNALILHSGLCSLIFSQCSQQLVAVTKELLALPYEQQPWFRGILTETSATEIAKGLPSTTMFLTYSRNNEVYLAFTVMNPYYRVLCKQKLLKGEDISTHFPPEKFVLGLHNGGTVHGLNEYFVRMAVTKGNLDEVKRLLAEHNLDLKTNKYFYEPDNMLKSYIFALKKPKINNDMVIWLIENGLQLERSANPPGKVLKQAVDNCDERVIRLLAEKKQEVDNIVMTTLIQRGTQYDTLKICWKSYTTLWGKWFGSLMGTFMESLNKKRYRSVSYKNRALVMMAWKYDENCLFRKLPKEIVLEMLSYDYIDEPPYWDFLDFIVENHPPDASRGHEVLLMPNEDVMRVIPLVWKNWDLPSYSVIKLNVLQALYYTDYTRLRNEDQVQTCLKWSLKFLQRITEPIMFKVSPNLTLYCLLTPNDMTLSILKLLVEKSPSDFTRSEHIQLNYIPVVFAAVLGENKSAIELLIDHNLLTEDLPGRDTLTGLFNRFPRLRPWKQFINDYRTNKNNKQSK